MPILDKKGKNLSVLGSGRVEMVDQSEYGTNKCYYVNIIEYCPKPYSLELANFAQFYLEKGLSARQIADLLGVSKSVVLNRLNQLGIRSDVVGQRVTNPENYRAPNPPYGYRVKDGKLVANRTELRTCRLIVSLIGQKGLSANAVAREIARRRIKNRKGSVKWGHFSVQGIYNRWKEKL